MRYDENSTWGSQDGRFIKIKDLEDTHLANIIKHLKMYQYNDGMLLAMILEARKRKLSPAFLERAHIPFKNKKGEWMLWSHKKGRSVKVG